MSQFNPDSFPGFITKVISRYIHELVGGEEAIVNSRVARAAEKAEDAKKVVATEVMSTVEKHSALTNIVSRKEEEERLKRKAIEDEKAKVALLKALEEKEMALRVHEEMSHNWVAKSHMAIISSIFLHCECDEHMFLEPAYIDRVFQLLCLPLPEPQAIATLDATVVLGKNKVGLKRFISHLKTIAYDLAHSHKLQRYRLLADLYLHPPLREAKTLLLER